VEGKREKQGVGTIKNKKIIYVIDGTKVTEK
jgi:hypothetical protein